jgi:hypothetical protein
MIHFKLFLLCGVLLLPLQNYTKHWEGSDVPGHSFAKFERFNGKQTFNIKLDKNESFQFNYKTNVVKGTLHLEVKSKSKTVLSKDLRSKESGELTVQNPKGEQYKFIFKARDASGNFDITYKAAPSN